MKRKGDIQNQSDENNFWASVQKQFNSNNFENIDSVRKALLCKPKLAQSLFPYLLEPVLIDSNLELQTRFHLLSNTAQYNFVTLICLHLHLFPDFPKQFLTSPLLTSIYESYYEKPPEITQREVTIEETQDQFEIPDLKIDFTNRDFFTSLDQLLSTYASHSKEIILNFCPIKSFQDFYSFNVGFFETVRSFEGIRAVMKEVILPYILSLTRSAHRQIGQALIVVAHSNLEIFVKEVIIPIFYDQNSGIPQFELMNRLEQVEGLKSTLIHNLFEGKVSTLEGEWTKEAKDYFGGIIKDFQEDLDSDFQKSILLQIQNQMNYDVTSSQRFLLHFLKNQKIKDEDIIIIAKECIEMLTGPTKKRALSFLNHT